MRSRSSNIEFVPILALSSKQNSSYIDNHNNSNKAQESHKDNSIKDMDISSNSLLMDLIIDRKRASNLRAHQSQRQSPRESDKDLGYATA